MPLAAAAATLLLLLPTYLRPPPDRPPSFYTLSRPSHTTQPHQTAAASPPAPTNRNNPHLPENHPQEIRSFEGFYRPLDKQLLFYVLGVLSLGLVFLLAKWSPRVHIALNLKRCALKDATFVRITVSGNEG
jgi:hypothetical protein